MAGFLGAWSTQVKKKLTINDTDREDWVDNDEGLYGLFSSQSQPKRQWVRENRAIIDAVINAKNTPPKRD